MRSRPPLRRARALLLLGALTAAAACGSDASAGEAASSSSAPSTSASSTGAPTPSAASGEDGTGRLFVVTGEADIQGDQLSVAGTEEVTWISDRPARRAGRVAPGELVAGWAPLGFRTDPPNAVLVAGDASTPVVLSEPSWADGELGFAVAPLDDATLPPGDLGAVELFIDDSSGVCTNTDDVRLSPPVLDITADSGDTDWQVPSCGDLLGGWYGAMGSGWQADALSRWFDGQDPGFSFSLYGIEWSDCQESFGLSCSGPAPAGGGDPATLQVEFAS